MKIEVVNKKCRNDVSSCFTYSLATFSVAMKGVTPEQSAAEGWRIFGEWMIECRDKLGWSQSYAAEQAEMERQQWSRIEKGASTKLPTVLRIADALKVPREVALAKSPFKLSQEKASLKIEDEDFHLLFHRYGQLQTEEDKAEIKALLRMVDQQIDLKLKKKKQ